jgi:hypothetical protein
MFMTKSMSSPVSRAHRSAKRMAWTGVITSDFLAVAWAGTRRPLAWTLFPRRPLRRSAGFHSILWAWTASASIVLSRFRAPRAVVSASSSTPSGSRRQWFPAASRNRITAPKTFTGSPQAAAASPSGTARV